MTAANALRETHSDATSPIHRPRAAIHLPKKTRETPVRPQEEIATRSSRTRKPPAYLNDYVCKQIEKESQQNEHKISNNNILSGHIISGQNNKSCLLTHGRNSMHSQIKELPTRGVDDYQLPLQSDEKNSKAGANGSSENLWQEFCIVPEHGLFPECSAERHAIRQ